LETVPPRRIRLPKYAMPWLVMVGACLSAAHWFPEYRTILAGTAFLAGGPLMAYLAVALPPGIVGAANVGRPAFRRIPDPGKSARPLFFAAGVCVTLLGIAWLAGWVDVNASVPLR